MLRKISKKHKLIVLINEEQEIAIDGAVTLVGSRYNRASFFYIATRWDVTVFMYVFILTGQFECIRRFWYIEQINKMIKFMWANLEQNV